MEKETSGTDNELRDDVVENPTVSEKYLASGLKLSTHGSDYQLRLLTLFVIRGLQKRFGVKLATEMVAAEKFDDVVFYYINEYEEKMIRFLQAKHKQDQTTTITYGDLISEAEAADFSLKKYFISYLKIQKNPEFKDYKLGYFVICTNIGLDKTVRGWFKPIVDQHKILDFRNGSELNFLNLKIVEREFSREERKLSKIKREIKKIRSERSKIKREISEIEDKFFRRQRLENNRKLLKKEKKLLGIQLKFQKSLRKKKLRSILLRSSEVFRLARILAICVCDKKPLELRDDLMKVYHGALEEKVIKRITTKSGEVVGKFREAFIVDGKSQELTRFRTAFYEEYQSVSKREMNENEFWKEMESTELKISQSFGQKCKSVEGGQLRMKSDLPNDYIYDTDIDNFFNNLVFAVNQPNEIDLGYFIKKEIGEYFNLINSKTLANELETYLRTWMKDYKDKHAPFLTKKDVEKFFDEIQQNDCELKIISVTQFCKRKVRKFDISFSEDLERVKNFLTTSDRVGICNLVCTYDTIFGSIKVLQILKKLDAYRKENSYIFMYLQDVLLLEDHEIRAFNSATIDLSVIVCETQEDDESLSNLFEKLKPAIFGKNKDKKVLLITLENDFLAKLFADYCSQNKDEACSYTKIKDEKNGFTDLDKESQNKILMKKIIFQGKETNVGTIIRSESTHLLSGVRLSELITNKKIELNIH